MTLGKYSWSDVYKDINNVFNNFKNEIVIFKDYLCWVSDVWLV